jgi:hypothetical protein
MKKKYIKVSKERKECKKCTKSETSINFGKTRKLGKDPSNLGNQKNVEIFENAYLPPKKIPKNSNNMKI